MYKGLDMILLPFVSLNSFSFANEMSSNRPHVRQSTMSRREWWM